MISLLNGIPLLALFLVAFLATSSRAAGPTLNHCVFTVTEGTTNVDGSPITDLASFRFKVGTAPGGPYTTLAAVASPSPNGGVTVTTANLCTGLPNGQKYAVATAVNTAGTESAPSAEVPFAYVGTVPTSPTLTVQ